MRTKLLKVLESHDEKIKKSAVGFRTFVADIRCRWRFCWSERSTELVAWGAEKANLVGARGKDLSIRTWRQRAHYDARTTGDILLAVQSTSKRTFRKQGELKWRTSLAWCHTESPLGESLGTQRTNTPCGPSHRHGRPASSSTSQGLASNARAFGSFRLTSW